MKLRGGLEVICPVRRSGVRSDRNVFLRVFPSLLFVGMLLGGGAARGDDGADATAGGDTRVRTHVPVKRIPAELEPEDGAYGAARAAGTAAVSGAGSGGKAQAPGAGASGLEHRLRLPFQVSGYAQGQWSMQPGADNTFQLRRARLRAIGEMGKEGMYRVEFDFANRPALLDAYTTLWLKPYLNVTAGQFKIPFSQESLAISAELPMVERAQVVNKLAPGRDNGSNGRDLGLAVSGTHNLRGSTGVDYAFGAFNGNGINTLGKSRKDVAARFVVRPAAGLMLAGEYFHGNRSGTEAERNRAGAEYTFERRRFGATGEFIQANDGALHRNGWYALERWRFSAKWEGLLRVDSYNANTGVKGSTTTIDDVGVNWLMRKHLRFQFNAGCQGQKGRWKPDVLSQMQVSF